MTGAVPTVSTSFDGLIEVEELTSLNGTQAIELNSADINLVATEVQINGVPISGASGIYLLRDGTLPMTGNLDMDGKNIVDAGTVAGTTNSRNANDILSCATDGVADRVV